MKNALAVFGGLLFATFLVVAPVRADSFKQFDVMGGSHERRAHLPFSIAGPDERLFIVKSEGKNAGWGFGLNSTRPVVGVTGYPDPPRVTAMPEATTILLLGTGLFGLGSLIRKRRAVKK